MRKITFLLLIAFVILLPSCIDNSGEKRMGLNGKLKTITQTTYLSTTKKGKIVRGELVDSCALHFNKEGYLTEVVGREYQLTYHYPAGPNDTYRMEWKGTDDKKRKAAVIAFAEHQYLLPQDSSRQRWEVMDHSTSPATRMYRIKEWNPEIRILRVTTLDEEKNIQGIEQLRYDERGNMIKLTFESDEMLYRKWQEFNQNDEKSHQWTEVYDYTQMEENESYLYAENDGEGYVYLKHDWRGNWTEQAYEYWEDWEEEYEHSYRSAKRTYTYY